MKKHLFKISVIALLLVANWGCKDDHGIIPEESRSNSTFSNVGSFVAGLKKTFYSKKLDEKLISNVDKRLTWQPDWDNPQVQKISDSTYYVFFKLIGYVETEGVSLKAKELGAASYLMIKNGVDYYKAFYKSGSGENQNDEFTASKFTGRLLLTNLETDANYVLDYDSGRFIDKSSSNNIAGKSSMQTKVSSWEESCNTQMRWCTYVTGSYICAGQIIIQYSANCQWPSYCQNAVWILTDYDLAYVCEYRWFPDPPNLPNTGGGGSTESKVINNADPKEKYEVETFENKINLKSKLDCFKSIADNSKTTYTARLCADLPDDDNPLALIGPDRVGHSFIILTKTNGNNTITQSFGFYPQKGYKSLSFQPVSSQIEDDGATQHEYNASYSVSLDQGSFERIINSAQTYSSLKYDLNGFNCTDYALTVFNVGLDIKNQISVPDWIPTTYNYGTTPVGLYKKIKEMKDAGVRGATITSGNAPVSSDCKKISQNGKER